MPGLKDRILETSRELLLEEGAGSLSMRRIAGRLDVSATAIYRHFRDKDALLARLTEDGFDQLQAYLLRPPPSPHPLERIRLLARQVAHFSLDHPRHYDFIFILPRTSVRRSPDDLERGRSATFDLLLEHVREGIRSGALVQDDPLEVGLTIWAHLHGLISLDRAGRFGTDSGRFLAIYTRSLDRLLSGIVPPGDRIGFRDTG